MGGRTNHEQVDRMNYSAKCCELTFDDGKALAAHLKASHPKRMIQEHLPYGGGRTIDHELQAPFGDPRVKVFVKPRVTLSKVEQEWLGQYVTVGICREVWQVWSLSHQPKSVWLVRNQRFMQAHIDRLTIRASASEYEDVAFNFELDDAA